MSKKAAVVLVLDVGYSDLLSNEEGKKFLETSRECASMIIQSKIFTSSKDEVSLVLMGCKDDFDEDSHHNILVACPLAPPTWHMVRKLKHDYTDYCKANWIDAVNVALQILRDKSGKFSEKKVVVFSSNLKLGSFKKLTKLEYGIHDQVADLILIHPKVNDDPKMAELNTEIKDAIVIVEKVEGTDIDIEDAALQLLSFQKRKVKPQAWNVILDIGSNIHIPVVGYKKINENQSMKWNDCLSSDGMSAIFPENFSSSSFKEALAENTPDTSTKVSRTNINVRCDGTEVERNEIIESFQFGSSIVPFTEEDKKQMKYISGNKCLSVVKVTKKIYVPRHFWIDKSTKCIVPRADDEDAAMAFSALVKALDHLNSVAIVRQLYYSNSKPHMGALFPVIKPKKEYLVFVELPFSNYMRKCLLPQLKVNHLSADQFEVIDQLIDGMDLSAPMDDDKESMMDRQWSDLLQPHKIFDPYLQHVRRCVASRVLNPGAPLPSIDPDLYKMLTEPPQSIKEAVSECICEISCLFPNLGMEDLRKKGRRKMDTTSVDANGENSAAGDEPATKQMKDMESEVQKESKEPEIVGILSPIEDFNAAVELSATPLIKVCKQMQEVIIKLVLNSFGVVDFEKPKDSLRILRNTIMNSKLDKGELVESFNKWMKDVHQLIQENFKMGFWTLIVQESLGFITNEECSESNLTVPDVNEILGVGALLSQTFSDDEEMDVPIDL